MNIIKSFFSRMTSDKVATLEATVRCHVATLKLMSAKYDKLMQMRSEELHQRDKDIASLRSKLQALKVQRKDLMLTSIRFTARLPDGFKRDTEFKLGLGPCGKVVEELQVWRKDGEMHIKQWHDDCTYKLFIYKEQDILGRIVETMGEVEFAESSALGQRQARARADRERLRNLNRAGRLVPRF